MRPEDINVVPIESTDEIGFGNRYALVMNGLSKYERIHPHGATFVVVNSPINRDRETDMADALRKAREFAAQEKIACVHLIA